jgi:hypothetical protein
MPERDSPLENLGVKLKKLGPPSLSLLIALLQDAEEYRSFVSLVREFLPEEEREILRQSTPARQMSAFATHFQDRYFPLDGTFINGLAEGYSELTRRIPVIALGISWEDYHYMADFRPGYQLMTYLLAAPEGQDDEARIPIGEACAEHIGADLLQRIPEGGITREEAHRLLEGTPYEALAHWADILSWQTGNFFLDTAEEQLYEDAFYPEWDKGLVEQLTQEWLKAEKIEEEVGNLADWLENDPPAHFEELLNFILERRAGEGCCQKR